MIERKRSTRLELPRTVNINADLVRIADSGSGAVSRTVGVGQTPLQTRWSALGDYLVTPAFNANALEIVNVATGTLTPATGLPGANSLALYADADGKTIALVGAFNSNELVRVVVESGTVERTHALGFQPGPLSTSP